MSKSVDINRGRKLLSMTTPGVEIELERTLLPADYLAVKWLLTNSEELLNGLELLDTARRDPDLVCLKSTCKAVVSISNQALHELEELKTIMNRECECGYPVFDQRNVHCGACA
jgi:hypothetical protein